jgi:hypothetical protein
VLSHPFWEGRSVEAVDVLPPQPCYEAIMLSHSPSKRAPPQEFPRATVTPGVDVDDGFSKEASSPSASLERHEDDSDRMLPHPSHVLHWQHVHPSQLIVCPADFEVTPIAGNIDIEPVTLPPVKWSSLSFPNLTAQDLSSLEESKMEDHVKVVASTLASALKTAPSTDEDTVASLQATVNYCAAVLAQVDTAVNVVMNCPLGSSLLIGIRTNSLPVPIRVSCAQCLAWCMRTASFVHPSLCSDKVLSSLRDVLLHDKHPDLRRPTVALLTELLFYNVSCAVDANPSAPAPIPAWFVGLLTRLLSKSEESDAITRHYAAKGVENVLTQALTGIEKLVTQEVSEALVDGCMQVRLTAYQRCCANALLHAARLKPGGVGPRCRSVCP